MKFHLKIVLLFLCGIGSVNQANAQHDITTFHGGIELGLAFTTIQPFQKAYPFFENINYGKTSSLGLGIFVNRFITPNHQLETGIFYTERGTAYLLESFIPILFSNSSNGNGQKYIELPLILNYYPAARSDFNYCIGAGYFHLLEQYYPGFYKNYDVELSLGLRFKINTIKYLKNDHFKVKFECSVLPVSIDAEVDRFNLENKDQFLKRQRNYAITFSLQHGIGEF